MRGGVHCEVTLETLARALGDEAREVPPPVGALFCDRLRVAVQMALGTPSPTDWQERAAFGKGRDSRNLEDRREWPVEPSPLSHELDKRHEIALVAPIKVQANVYPDVIEQRIDDRHRACE